MGGFTFQDAMVTYILLGVTILVSYKGFSDSVFRNKLLFNPYRFKNGKAWHLLFTHGFIHGSQMHLIFNMFGLFFFGRIVEAYLTYSHGLILGKLLFIVLYFGSMAFACIPSIRKHGNNPGYNSLGASGAVYAVLMGFVLIAPTEKICLYGILCLPGYIMAALFFVTEYYADKRGGTGIAHDAHIWGGIFGILMLVVLDYTLLIEFVNAVVNNPLGK